MTGTGDDHGQIKYIKDVNPLKFNEKSIIYTSGTGAIFKSGIPIGKIRDKEKKSNDKFFIEFFSDFSQLKYVFAEVTTKTEILDKTSNADQKESQSITPMSAKIKILEDELKIIEDINLKFKGENELLKSDIINLSNEIGNLNQKIFSQTKEIEKFNLDTAEVKFLKMNLYYGHKCRRSFFNTKGFTVGSEDYKNCVLNKGRKN